MVMGFEDPDALPRLSAPAFACLLGAIGTLWLFARVLVERRRQQRGQATKTRLAFVRRLARQPAALPALAVGCALLAVATWLLARA